MARAFVLIDAMTGREQEVYQAVASLQGVLARRMLQPRAGTMDMVVLLEGKDMDEIDKLVIGKIRAVSGVHSVQRMMPQHSMLGNLPKIIAEIERELAAKK